MTSGEPRANVGNLDPATVSGFAKEWAAFDQFPLDPAEQKRLFEQYFSNFPWDELPDKAEGFDLGCGSGRWAALVAPRVDKLHCVDPAPEALAVCRRRLAGFDNVQFHLAAAETVAIADGSQDFGYSLGVLHHVPDTKAALEACVRKLKPGAPFLLYIYYAFDNRPSWFRAIWRITDGGRRLISRLPFPMRKLVTSGIAAAIYWPLSRSARLLEAGGRNVSNFPLSAYRDCSFYTLRTDALDRFGTRLEQRFSRAQIEDMMIAAGLERVVFRNDVPFWVACGKKRHSA